jgi:4-hydroxybutyryl-CoA dehydratase/vinylacetyl-CoA-Delta-isomerase
MALKTPEQYEESLRKLNLKVYLQGELVESPVDHPIIRPSMNSAKATYALAQDPQYENLMTAKSHLTGKKINRFCHLHQSTEDLVKKVKMQRLLGQTTCSCFQRCVGMDAINSIDTTTFEMDKKLGTDYHKRFEKFLLKMQEEDLMADGAMTDPKGDRGLSPTQQADPDMYLHVVEKRKDGIVVRGAKCHQTGCINSHAIIVMPTIAMTAEDVDYAVSFWTPSDAEGIFYIYGRQSCDTRKLEGGTIDVGNKKYGGHEALMVFRQCIRSVGKRIHVRRIRVQRNASGTFRRLSSSELRRLQGRRRRRADRSGSFGG